MKGLALAVLLVAAPAYGQSAQVATEALDAIRAHDMLLQTAFTNLSAMRATSNQGEEVDAVLNEVMLFQTAEGITTAVGNILPHMKHERDATAVRVQLQHSVTTVLQITDAAVKYVNGVMALLKQPAVVAETTKIRDEMIAIREQLLALKT